jgi:hypothetical protein
MSPSASGIIRAAISREKRRRRRELGVPCGSSGHRPRRAGAADEIPGHRDSPASGKRHPFHEPRDRNEDRSEAPKSRSVGVFGEAGQARSARLLPKPALSTLLLRRALPEPEERRGALSGGARPARRRSEGQDRGNLTEPLAMKGQDVTLEIQGEDMAGLFPLIRVVFPPTPPYRLSGRLRHEGTVWSFSNFAGRVGDGDLAGDIRVDAAPKPPLMKADLVSKRLDFDDLGGFIGAAPAAGAEETASAKQQKIAAERKSAERIFPDRPYHLGLSGPAQDRNRIGAREDLQRAGDASFDSVSAAGPRAGARHRLRRPHRQGEGQGPLRRRPRGARAAGEARPIGGGRPRRSARRGFLRFSIANRRFLGWRRRRTVTRATPARGARRRER